LSFTILLVDFLAAALDFDLADFFCVAILITSPSCHARGGGHPAATTVRDWVPGFAGTTVKNAAHRLISFSAHFAG
jgi:hypothetical protein